METLENQIEDKIDNTEVGKSTTGPAVTFNLSTHGNRWHYNDESEEEYGFNEDDRNCDYDAEQFHNKEAEHNGSKVLKEGIVVTKNNVAQIKASIQDESIDIYDVIVTNNKGEKMKIRDMIKSLNEEQKKLINLVMEENANILGTLIEFNMVEIDKYLCQLHQLLTE